MKYLLLLFISFSLVACTPSLRPQSISSPATYYQKMDYSTGGFQRAYNVHVPSGYDGITRLPLVVVVHGAFDTAKGIEKFSGFSRLADRENFIVLYPEGIGIFGWLQHWNAGHCCGKAAEDGIDDVGYLASAIEDVSKRVAVDRKRVYMVGFSNGGMLTYRFAAERGELLAAAAPMAASIGGRPSNDAPEWQIPDPVKPLPLIVVHGKADNDIPLAGGRSDHRKGERTYWSVDASVKFWIKHNGCKEPPSETHRVSGSVQVRTWEDCRDKATVALYTIAKWGHVWPGPYFTGELPHEDPLYNFDISEIIWDFFKGLK